MNEQRRLLSGRYEIGEVLGRGGMAVVHAGRDVRLGRQVAIKMLRADLARDPSFQARFRREAQSAAALNHPSIVAVYDTGEDVVAGLGAAGEATPFIIMEYVSGRTLREILEEGPSEERGRHRAGPWDTGETPGGIVVSDPLDPTKRIHPLAVEQAVHVTAGVLSALDYSHRAGIVHRDIKPANVMVTDAGSVKVMDFGIARAVADASATMTQTQAVIGTAQYLSPEQARGETVDSRSDLYSAGCLLYELLTGRPPFVGDSPVSVAVQHVNATPPPPSSLNPKVGADIDRVIMHALSKDRADRYQEASVFRHDLLAALDGRPVTAPTAVVPAGGATTVLAPPPGPPPAGATQVMRHSAADPTPEPAYEAFDELDQEPPKRGRAAGYIGLVIGLLAVLGLGAFVLAQVLSEPDNDPVSVVVVPDLRDMTAQEARTALSAQNLEYAEGTAAADDTIKAGNVISQDPAANESVDEDSTVTVVLSTGPSEAEVPNLSDLSQGEAREALTDAGLKVGNVDEQDHPSIEGGNVISSDPARGTKLPVDSEVSLVISSGSVTLPDLRGQSYDDARAAIAGLGLTVADPETRADGSVDPNTVLEQSPVAGSVEQGSTVELVIAAEPEPTPSETFTPTPTETTTTPPEEEEDG